MNHDQTERIRETLRYFDTAHFAARTKADGFFTAAFLDSVVHPTTVYAAYNSVRGAKGIYNDLFVGHQNTPQAIQKMRAAVLEHLSQQVAK